MRPLAWSMAVWLWLMSGCSGPAASDAAVCRDVIHRLCISECGEAYNQLGLSKLESCEPTLLQRTRCGDENFMFEQRDIFLSCRLPLLRAGDGVNSKSDCSDVDDFFRACPSMVQFLGGP